MTYQEECAVDGCGHPKAQHISTTISAYLGSRGDREASSMCIGCQQEYVDKPQRAGEHWHPDWWEMMTHSYVGKLA